MGCRQTARHRPLEPAFGGSNPPAPARNKKVDGILNKPAKSY